jgi:hypothetical protein
MLRTRQLLALAACLLGAATASACGQTEPSGGGPNSLEEPDTSVAQQPSPDAASSDAATGFQPFIDEVAVLRDTAGCSNPKVTPAEMGLGALFGCIEGSAETAKLFVNEEPGTGRVENVKVMWNDWFRDTGHGLHSDRLDAERLLNAVLARYAPDQGELIRQAYFSGRTHDGAAGPYRLRVTHTRGPSIEEHLLVVAAR